jgi:ParB family transcriptional regulator, chromosome partitioning protein
MSTKSAKQKKPTTPVTPAKQTPAPAPSKHPRPGLGKGFGLLIGNTTISKHTPQMPTIPPHQTPAPSSVLPTSAPSHSIHDIPPGDIERSPWQPRHIFDEESLAELTESIKAKGIISPLICRKNANGRYELIAGERRLRAALAAELKKVPVILREAEDRTAAEIAIIENIQRQDLNIIEEAEGYRTLAEHFNLTQQEVAERVGKPRASIANVVRLLDLPDEVKQFIADKRLSTGHAKVLLGLTDVTEQTLLGRKCVTEELTVRSLEKLIQRRKASTDGTQERKRGTPDLPESYLRDLTDRMHKHFGTAVRLTPGVTHANGRHTKGQIEIDFYDNDDLDRLLGILGISVE